MRTFIFDNTNTIKDAKRICDALNNDKDVVIATPTALYMISVMSGVLHCRTLTEQYITRAKQFTRDEFYSVMARALTNNKTKLIKTINKMKRLYPLDASIRCVNTVTADIKSATFQFTDTLDEVKQLCATLENERDIIIETDSVYMFHVDRQLLYCRTIQEGVTDIVTITTDTFLNILASHMFIGLTENERLEALMLIRDQYTFTTILNDRDFAL